MTVGEINVWVPAISAVAGVLIGSIAPVLFGLINTRAESRRTKRLRAVREMLEERKT